MIEVGVGESLSPEAAEWVELWLLVVQVGQGVKGNAVSLVGHGH